jgi:hypothetical protein
MSRVAGSAYANPLKTAPLSPNDGLIAINAPGPGKDLKSIKKIVNSDILTSTDK